MSSASVSKRKNARARKVAPAAGILMAAIGFVGCVEPSRRAEVEDAAAPLVVRDIDGVAHRPLAAGAAAARVLVFTTTDCPVANSYAPEIGSIFDDYSARGVEFFLVHVDPDTTAQRARQHAREYDLPATILLDPMHRLVDRTGVTITPEVAVIDRHGDMVYRGRIDGRYSELGKRRRTFRDHDLREALDAVLAGEPVFPARTKAIGCIIADFRPVE